MPAEFDLKPARVGVGRKARARPEGRGGADRHNPDRPASGQTRRHLRQRKVETGLLGVDSALGRRRRGRHRWDRLHRSPAGCVQAGTIARTSAVATAAERGLAIWKTSVAHESRISPCSRFPACGYCSALSSKGCSRLASMMRHPFVSILPLCGKFSRLTIYLFISVTSWGRWAASRLTTIHFVSPARKPKLGGADDRPRDARGDLQRVAAIEAAQGASLGQITGGNARQSCRPRIAGSRSTRLKDCRIGHGCSQNSVSFRHPPDRGEGGSAFSGRPLVAGERLLLLGLHDHAHQSRPRDGPAQDAALAHHRRASGACRRCAATA